MFQINDGGKSIPNEVRDCTVRALSIAKGISYESAHAELKNAGRKNGHKFEFKEWANKNLGNKLGFRRKTLGKFLKEYREGRFILKRLLVFTFLYYLLTRLTVAFKSK